jgi:hypothetical protein
MKLNYIILKNNFLLSKKNYSSWREIQDEYNDSYITSLGPWTLEELLDYFLVEYKKESNWPFSQSEIEKFIVSKDLEMKSQN